MSVNFPVKKVVFWSWLVLMTVYFLWSIWNGVILATYSSGQQSGAENAIATVIERANNKKCEPFNVYVNENKVDLINVACLQKQTSTEDTSGAQKKK